jgi:UDP-N-acetylglucosamine--N-acetylmuramyl-(pentapeptide) pyrophosphoryl-undecaprenol N-acetylglucosamine transferase
VFPAIAIADALKDINPENEFLFVGALGRMEMEKVPEAGYKITGLPVAGFQRRITFKNVTFFFKLVVSMIRSRKIIRQFKPDVAVGVGGYASGPILKAAARGGVPILIQEQNSYAGVTNRLLAKSAGAICVAYEKMDRYFPSDRIILTGNPVRQNMVKPSGNRASAVKEFGIEPSRKVCLVVGGSLGAMTLNQSVVRGMDKLDRDDLHLLWQCGFAYQKEAEEHVLRSRLKNISVLPFIGKMDLAYEAADVIVSRAGAITISELCIVGKPVILVPSPNVAEDHQTRNAEALVSKKAAVLIPDHLAAEHLVDKMLKLIGDEGDTKELSKNIKALGISDAAQRIAEEVYKTVEEQ